MATSIAVKIFTFSVLLAITTGMLGFLNLIIHIIPKTSINVYILKDDSTILYLLSSELHILSAVFIYLEYIFHDLFL